MTTEKQVLFTGKVLENKPLQWLRYSATNTGRISITKPISCRTFEAYGTDSSNSSNQSAGITVNWLYDLSTTTKDYFYITNTGLCSYFIIGR